MISVSRISIQILVGEGKDRFNVAGDMTSPRQIVISHFRYTFANRKKKRLWTYGNTWSVSFYAGPGTTLNAKPQPMMVCFFAHAWKSWAADTSTSFSAIQQNFHSYIVLTVYRPLVTSPCPGLTRTGGLRKPTFSSDELCMERIAQLLPFVPTVCQPLAFPLSCHSKPKQVGLSERLMFFCETASPRLSTCQRWVQNCVQWHANS